MPSYTWTNTQSQRHLRLPRTFYMKISVESFKRSIPIQCYHCQSFEHGSSHCSNRPRCVMCAGDHKASDSVKTKEESPICSNCSGNYMENYRGYPYFSDIENKKPAKPKSVPLLANQIEQSTPEFQSVSYNHPFSNINPLPSTLLS